MLWQLLKYEESIKELLSIRVISCCCINTLLRNNYFLKTLISLESLFRSNRENDWNVKDLRIVAGLKNFLVLVESTRVWISASVSLVSIRTNEHDSWLARNQRCRRSEEGRKRSFNQFKEAEILDTMLRRNELLRVITSHLYSVKLKYLRNQIVDTIIYLP